MISYSWLATGFFLLLGGYDFLLQFISIVMLDMVADFLLSELSRRIR